MSKDWAEQIFDNYNRRLKALLKKGRFADFSCTPQSSQSLREEVYRICDQNVERAGNLSEKEKNKFIETETKRLIKWRLEQDTQDELVFKYALKDLVIEPDFGQIGKIGSVKLDFDDGAWKDLLNTEGEYLPACCHKVSRIRDILAHALRYDGLIDIEDLAEAASLAEDEGYKSDDGPVGKLITYWKMVKKDTRVSVNPTTVDISDPKDAFKTLYEVAATITTADIGLDIEGKEFAHDAIYNQALSTVRAAIHTLYHKLGELEPKTTKGYGIFDSKGELVCSSVGLSVYKNKAKAQKLCACFNERYAQEAAISKKQKHIPKAFVVKKVKISAKTGLEIIHEKSR